MGFLTAILGYFGMFQKAAPLVEELLAGIGHYVGKFFSDVFGANAGAALDEAMQDAGNAVKTMDGYATTAENEATQFWTNEAGTLEKLWAIFPGLEKELFARLLTAQGIAAKAGKTVADVHGTAGKLVTAQHANERTVRVP